MSRDLSRDIVASLLSASDMIIAAEYKYRWQRYLSLPTTFIANGEKTKFATSDIYRHWREISLAATNIARV